MASQIPWRMSGEQIANCGCAWGCPCQFNALPTRGRCQAFIGFEVREGHFGPTRLDGLRAAAVFSWPGAIHHGNGQALAVIDERADAAQREALIAIMSGQHGAMFAMYASTLSKMHTPRFLPIEFEIDRERRTARLAVEGVGETRSVPIRNPVTGEEHRARIDLPNGLEYHLAEMADAEFVRAEVGDERFAFEHTYSQLNAFDWRNP